MAEKRENTIALRPKPEPFFNATNQKELAVKYIKRLIAAKYQCLLKDQFFAKISASASKNTN